jgi:hypothetical protein
MRSGLDGLSDRYSRRFEMRHFIVLLASTLFCACGGGNGGAKSVGIIWSTSELVLKYTPATKTSVEVSFTSDTDLGTTETRVTSELDPFMVVGIPGSEEVVAGVNTALDVIVLLESNDTPGVVMGDIELVQNGTVIAQLPVMLELSSRMRTATLVSSESAPAGTMSSTPLVPLNVPPAELTVNVSSVSSSMTGSCAMTVPF